MIRIFERLATRHDANGDDGEHAKGEGAKSVDRRRTRDAALARSRRCHGVVGVAVDGEDRRPVQVADLMLRRAKRAIVVALNPNVAGLGQAVMRLLAELARLDFRLPVGAPQLVLD